VADIRTEGDEVVDFKIEEDLEAGEEEVSGIYILKD
jgi:hypothetical protein